MFRPKFRTDGEWPGCAPVAPQKSTAPVLSPSPQDGMNTFQLWAWRPWHSGVCGGGWWCSKRCASIPVHTPPPAQFIPRLPDGDPFAALGWWLSLPGCRFPSEKLGEAEVNNLKGPHWQQCPVKPASFPQPHVLSPLKPLSVQSSPHSPCLGIPAPLRLWPCHSSRWWQGQASQLRKA